MDKPSLEHYFNRFIANDVLSTEKQEEVTEEEQEELFFKLLPDELLALNRFTWDDTAESRIVDKPSPDSSSTLDYSSQNSSAGAEFTQVSSAAEMEASTVNHITPAVLEIFEELPKPTPVICNVLSAVNLGCHLDLGIIARNMWNVEYNPKTFRGLIARNREPKATVTMFTTGKMICTGADSMVKSRLVVRKFARKLQKLGFPVRFLNFKIHNLVATCRAFAVNLEKLYKICRQNCSYEPEISNGLLYQMAPNGITVTIFTSGNIILFGAKSPDAVYEVFETIFSHMRHCRKP